MQFVYCEDAKEKNLELSVQEFRHIFKVRRTKTGDVINFRNLRDDYIYGYRVTDIDKKSAYLELIEKKELAIKAKPLHVSWCVVDSKTVEKTLPFLNEFGVKKVTFVYCEFSQKNFKIDLDRLQRIAVNSSQQCGRSEMIELEIIESLEKFLERYPDASIVDFSDNKLKCGDKIGHFLVGCEGGFSAKEREMFNNNKVFGLDFETVLKSESAVLYATSLFLS